MNARDLADRVERILAETDAVGSWLSTLSKRTSLALETAKKNEIYQEEQKAQLRALLKAHAALNRARAALDAVEAAPAVRDGKAA